MEATELEKAVIGRLLGDAELKPTRHDVNFASLQVVERTFSEVGFLTEFERNVSSKLFNEGTCLRWGKVGARLNESGIETAYLVFIDRGYVTALEGYTYGDRWPDSVNSIELYDLVIGTELGTGATK